MKEMIDVDIWKRKRQYKFFSAFPNPCYTVGKRIDVTNVVRYVKANRKSFFACFVYILTRVCNEFEGYHLRMDKENHVCRYTVIHPSYTVLLPDETYDTCMTEFVDDFEKMYQNIREDIKRITSGELNHTALNEDERNDVFYYSCIPWIDVESYSNPLPLDRPESLSIPRINWGKFVPVGERYEMYISFTVNHALMDGYELAKSILRLQEALDAWGESDGAGI